MNKSLIPIFLIIIALLFHNDFISGTRSGLLLWYQTLIPALLPFILITNALSKMNTYQMLAQKMQHVIPDIYLVLAVVTGNLCGYPVGAKILNDLVSDKLIEGDRANSMLALSSQASPMFLIGYVYNLILKDKLPLYVFLLSIYIPVIILYLIRRTKIVNASLNYSKVSVKDDEPFDISNTFIQTIKTILFIGIYVIIFSIIIELFNTDKANICFKCALSFLEITTGLNLLISLHLKEGFLICLICILSAFGGLCTMFQIKCVLTYKNASIKKYLPDKLLLSAGTLIIITLYQYFRSFCPL